MNHEILYPCVTIKNNRATFLELAEMFYEDRFDAYKEGQALAICPWLTDFGVRGFRTAFRPYYLPEDCRWFDGCYCGTDKQKIYEVNDHRVFALLFMHELHKDYLENLHDNISDVTVQE